MMVLKIKHHPGWASMKVAREHRSLVLQTRSICLREIEDRDLPVIFQWRNSDKFRFLLHYNTAAISYEEFRQEFAVDSEMFRFRLLIEKIGNKAPVGMIYTDCFSERFKSCFINIYVAEPFERKGFGMHAFVLLAIFLFEHEDLNKLFAHAFDSNHHSISCIRNLGFRELVGNVTDIHRGWGKERIICFAAGREIVPRLSAINEFLSGARLSP
jgi:RimJ/RimL family protein N-acetyltransferase